MGFSVELWDGFETIYVRIREGKVFCTKSEEFFKKRAEIEREFAKKLIALCKSTEFERGTLNSGWQSIKLETENIAKRHQEFAEHMVNQIQEPLQSWIKENAKNRKN